MLRHPRLLSPTLTLHKLIGKTYWKTVKTKKQKKKTYWKTESGKTSTKMMNIQDSPTKKSQPDHPWSDLLRVNKPHPHVHIISFQAITLQCEQTTQAYHLLSEKILIGQKPIFKDQGCRETICKKQRTTQREKENLPNNNNTHSSRDLRENDEKEGWNFFFFKDTQKTNKKRALEMKNRIGEKKN